MLSTGGLNRCPLPAAAAVATLLIGCGGENVVTPPPPPPPPSTLAACANFTPLTLAVGQHQVVDPAQSQGCVRVPAAGGQGAEYLVVAASTASLVTSSGVSGPFLLRAGNPGGTASPSFARTEAQGGERPGGAAEAFHLRLRALEQELLREPGVKAAPAPAPGVLAVPPVVGEVRTFKACGNLTCSSFVDVAATARFVGTKAAVFADNTVPTADTLLEVDYQELGQTFDNRLYPIDQAAFGSESDIDTNQRIIILMTDAVNALTPNCTGGRVVGYFFGLDLITTGSQAVNSNKAEIFFTLVPAPATANCSAYSRNTAVRSLKATLVHELQHMISWNQRVIVRGGNSEETWLNEALSHFAEELAGRQIPDVECPGFSSCRSQYVSGNIFNSYDYLSDPESHFLIYPESSTGTLEERGASWSFLRWVVDQFAADSILGSDMTPALLQTTSRGANNIVARTGSPMTQLVPEWLMALYLDDRPGFTPASARLRLKSWGLRGVWTNPADQQQFPGGFPLKPDSTGGAYSRAGTLRGGSGRHLRLIQAANGPGIDVQLVRDATGAALDAALAARIGVVRVR
ncbi:MAG: hypothetical protein FJ206_16650 [Gemmatimonadetes bacterium]|nr:hypothetical protein [Gemmatimonadota bacterium]